MDTIFYVLDKNLQKVGMIDTFESLIWCKRYYEIGAFDLEIEASQENINLFQKGFYITRTNDDMICRIEAIQIDTRGDKSNVMVIGGVDCKTILSQRIIADTINFSGTFNNYIKRIVDENIISPQVTGRKIPNFSYVSNTALSDRIVQQVTYDNVAEKIISLCRSYLYGWKVYLENGTFKITLYKGKELNLVFSPKNDNLYSSKYKMDATEFKNTALVGGEGEGAKRVLVWFGDTTGLDRYEMFVDESMSSEEMADIEYLQKLKSKGGEEVSKEKEVVEFEGEIDMTNNVYKEDFDLGDVVTIENEYGISTKARITEVIETWDKNGYSVEPKLEYLEFMPISPEIELKKELFSSYNISDISGQTLSFSATEHPYGITIELYGAKGQDGQSGFVQNAFVYKNSDGTGVAFVSAGGGTGGTGGSGADLTFSIDGKSYKAFSQGGSGGGGGGGGVAGNSLTDGNQVTYMEAGAGGKGSSGDVITISISFFNSVQLTVKESGNGGKGSSGESKSLNIMGTFSLSTGGKGGNAWEKQIGEAGTTSQAGKGADASPTGGSYCQLASSVISNTSTVDNPLIKIYTWKSV